MPEHLPAIGAQQPCGLFFLRALLLHQWDQLTGHERHGHEDCRQHDTRQRENDLNVVILQPRPENATGAKHQDVDQTGDHRRDREWQVDQRHQNCFATERVLAHTPGRRDTEHNVQGHGDQHRIHGELECRQGIRLKDRREEAAQTVFQALTDDHEQR